MSSGEALPAAAGPSSGPGPTGHASQDTFELVRQPAAAALELPGFRPEERKEFFNRLSLMLRAGRWHRLAPVGPGDTGHAPPALNRAQLDAISKRAPSLAADPAHGRDLTPCSVNEAAVAFAGELMGVLQGPVQREATGQAEFVDTQATLWDVKAPRSPEAGEVWRYDARDVIAAVQKDLGHNNKILLDLTRCNAGDTQQTLTGLRQGLSAAELANILVLSAN